MEDFEFEACIRQIQQGDKEGLKSIYQAYVGLIYSIVYDMTNQKEDAQDITSEFFIRLWDKANVYRFGGKHKAWLLTIARNMTIDFMRKNKRTMLVEDPETEHLKEPVAQESDFAEEIIGNLSMQEAVKLLKPEEQDVLNLKIIGELTFREIAKILKKPMGTVTWLYRQGIGKLQKYYHAEEVQE